MKLKILINNDDGIKADGIKELIHSLQSFAEIYVVAPANEQSGKSLSITTHAPLKVEKVDLFGTTPAWSVTGTPADCTKIALSILHIQPDLILSGINRGSNAGRNVLYSGTVGGVVEGILRGIPGIAFSCCDAKEPEYSRLSPYILPIVTYILEHPLPLGTLLNVNFPHTMENMPWEKTSEIQGIKLTRQGKGLWMEHVRSHPTDLQEGVQFGAKAIVYDEEADSDMYWLERGYITGVPIHVDELTDWRYFNQHKEHFEKITLCPISF